MNNLKVFTDSRKFELGGEWSCAAEDIEKNFPCCKLAFFSSDIKEGDTDWVSRANPSLIKLQDTGGVPVDADGVTAGSLSSVGTVGTLSDKAFLFMVLGRVNAVGNDHTLGNVTKGPGIDFSFGTGNYIVRDASNYAELNAIAPAPSFPTAEYLMSAGFSSVSNSAFKVATSQDFSYEGFARPTSQFNGTTDGTSTGQLVDSTKDFSVAGVTVGMNVFNLATGKDTKVKTVGTTTLTLEDDIFVSGQGYGVGDLIAGNIQGVYADFVSISLNPNANTRTKNIFVFAFGSDITEQELRIGHKWMAANPGKIYPGWAGRS